jgi:hypothetical protein
VPDLHRPLLQLVYYFEFYTLYYRLELLTVATMYRLLVTLALCIASVSAFVAPVNNAVGEFGVCQEGSMFGIFGTRKAESSRTVTVGISRGQDLAD